MIYEFGSTASAYLENDNADYVNVFAFTSEITRRAEEYGFDPYAEPQEIPMDDEFRDATLEVSQDAVDFFGGTRVVSNLSSVAASPGYPDCQITDRCALIVVARIVLVPGVRRGDTTDLSPYVATLALANLYGQVIAFYAAMDRGCVPPAGLQDLWVGIRNDWRYMRCCSLEYLGCGNVLVGFNISWILTALQLVGRNVGRGHRPGTCLSAAVWPVGSEGEAVFRPAGSEYSRSIRLSIAGNPLLQLYGAHD